jgi:hypothetical protein
MSRLARWRSASTDEFLESYVCWREACEDVRIAYRRWASCTSGERDLGFAAYRAALEREERASGIHFDWVRSLGARTR